MRYWFDGSELLTFPVDLVVWFNQQYPDPFLEGTRIALDAWGRGVVELSEEQAQELARIVREWNWRGGDLNPFPIAFSLTDGTEHRVRVEGPNGHVSWSWQLG
jgi:hypothetical protein